MPDFGIITIPTHYTLQPAELALWAEAQGFESLWFGEHSHIPTSRKSPFPFGSELPQYYKEFFDPFVGLATAAAVTSSKWAPRFASSRSITPSTWRRWCRAWIACRTVDLSSGSVRDGMRKKWPITVSSSRTAGR